MRKNITILFVLVSLFIMTSPTYAQELEEYEYYAIQSNNYIIVKVVDHWEFYMVESGYEGVRAVSVFFDRLLNNDNYLNASITNLMHPIVENREESEQLHNMMIDYNVNVCGANPRGF